MKLERVKYISKDWKKYIKIIAKPLDLDLILLNFNINFEYMGILTTLEMYTICATGVYGGWKGSHGTRVTVPYELLNSGTQTQDLHKSSKYSEDQSHISSP